MADDKDYRDLVNERFTNIITLMNAQFDAVHDKLNRIETQTVKTNGRVTKVEDEIHNMKLADRDHISNCPYKDKIEAINSDLMEYKMIKKYPKYMIAGLVLYGLITIFLTYKTFFPG